MMSCQGHLDAVTVPPRPDISEILAVVMEVGVSLRTKTRVAHLCRRYIEERALSAGLSRLNTTVAVGRVYYFTRVLPGFMSTAFVLVLYTLGFSLIVIAPMTMSSIVWTALCLFSTPKQVSTCDGLFIFRMWGLNSVQFPIDGARIYRSGRPKSWLFGGWFVESERGDVVFVPGRANGHETWISSAKSSGTDVLTVIPPSDSALRALGTPLRHLRGD